MNTTYNGWSNYETWNVSLWINNDETIYLHARKNGNLGYKLWAKRFRDEFGVFQTADGVDWISDRLDYDELDEMMSDL